MPKINKTKQGSVYPPISYRGLIFAGGWGHGKLVLWHSRDDLATASSRRSSLGGWKGFCALHHHPRASASIGTGNDRHRLEDGRLVPLQVRVGGRRCGVARRRGRVDVVHIIAVGKHRRPVSHRRGRVNFRGQHAILSRRGRCQRSQRCRWHWCGTRRARLCGMNSKLEAAAIFQPFSPAR